MEGHLMAEDCSISNLALHSYKLEKNEYEKKDERHAKPTNKLLIATLNLSHKHILRV